MQAHLIALRFNDAAATAYHFVYDIFCDWYLEIAKPIFNGTDETAKAETRATAAWARDNLLKLLHPFMPFITEELWALHSADRWPGESADRSQMAGDPTVPETCSKRHSTRWNG